MTDIVSRIKYTERVCDHRWRLVPELNEMPECEPCMRLKEAVQEIERLRQAIAQFYVAEREYEIAKHHPESLSEGERSYAVTAYNTAVGKLRRMVVTDYAE